MKKKKRAGEGGKKRRREGEKDEGREGEKNSKHSRGKRRDKMVI